MECGGPLSCFGEGGLSHFSSTQPLTLSPPASFQLTSHFHIGSFPIAQVSPHCIMCGTGRKCVYDYHIGTNFIIIPSIQFQGGAIGTEQCYIKTGLVVHNIGG